MKNFLVIKYRWIIIAATITIVASVIYPLVTTQINSDLESYLPLTIPARMNEIKIQEIFGENDPVIILFEANDVLNNSTLNRIRSLSKEFNRMKEFDMVMSLFDAKNINGSHRAMIVDPVVKRIPKSDKQREKLRTQIKENTLVYRFIVSEDFRYTSIILNPRENVSDEEIIEPINQLLKEFSGNEKVTIAGNPYLRYEANNKIVNDFIILLPIGLVLMLVFLIVSFRQLRGAILPFLVVVFSIVISLAIIPLLNWELSIIGIIIPIMMIAIANDYGIHFISHFQEIIAKEPDKSVKELTAKTTRYLIKPIALTGITTIVGISGLITHILLPAKQMGVAAAIGIAFALIFSLTFIPAVNSMLRKGKIHKSASSEGNSILDKILQYIAYITTQKPRNVIYFFTLFLIISILGISKFELAADNNKIFAEDHPYNHTLQVVNRELGGSKSISLIFEGDIKDPAILKRMDYYEQELKKIPEIGSVNSIATIIKIMSKAINDKGDSLYNVIPNSREAVAQYLELYSMSGDPEDFEDFVDFDYTQGRLNIQYTANTMETMRSVENTIRALIQNDKNITIVGGYSLVEKELSEAVAKGQMNSLLFALVAIMILLFVIFRSWVAGLLGSLPLVFTVLTIFGLMGWLHIELNIVTALLSSISIGLGVDYSIHLFWRVKTELKNSNNFEEAISKSIKTTGRGITINAFSVIIGFVILYLSAFPYIRSFAFLIVMSIFLCLLGAMILIPAIFMLSKPKFLKNNNHK